MRIQLYVSTPVISITNTIFPLSITFPHHVSVWIYVCMVLSATISFSSLLVNDL